MIWQDWRRQFMRWSRLTLFVTLLLLTFFSCTQPTQHVSDVSLAIPALAEDFHFGWLQQVVGNIKQQSVRPREVIFVLSNTTDSEAKTISRYLKYTLRPIRTLVTSSKFLSSPGKSRNRALQLAQGEIVSFFDADDTMHPHRLEVIARAFEASVSLQMVLHGLKYPGENLAMDVTYTSAHKVYRDELCEAHRQTLPLHAWLTSDIFRFEVAHGHLSIRKGLSNTFMFTEDMIGEDCGFVRSVLQTVCSQESRIAALYLDVPLTTYLPRYRKKILISENK